MVTSLIVSNGDTWEISLSTKTQGGSSRQHGGILIPETGKLEYVLDLETRSQ